MSVLQQQVRRAQRRLWLNRWLGDLGWCLAGAGAIFVVVTVFRRVMGLEINATDAWLAVGGLVAACVAAAVWTAVRREAAIVAATALDEAAGLKERISSGLYCTEDSDPFAQAVHEEAKRVSGSLSVRQHIRLRFPQSMAVATGTLVAAGLVFWLVKPFETEASQRRLAEQQQVERIERTKATIKRQIEQQKKQLAQTNPELKKLEEFESLGDLSTGKPDVPSDLIRDQMKKLDSLADAVRRREAAGEGLPSLKKMLRQIEMPKSPDPAASKLSKALAEGDFKAASEAVKEMQEQLAKAGNQQNKERMRELQKNLNALSDKLAKMGNNDKLKDQMKKAGLSEEQAKRMLENLSKKDLSQMKKEMEKAGLNKQQAEKLLKEMQQRQSACKMCSRLGSAMKQAAQGMGDLQVGQSIEGLQAAADQLGDLEMLEEEMKQLQSSLSQLSQMKDGLGQQCMGMQDQMKRGDGMGQLGQGRGSIAPEEETRVDFKTERDKVQTQKGRIIGQFLIDGEQVSGQSKAEFKEAVSAERRQASDAIKENRIPRKYQDPVKKYYSLMNPDAGEGESGKR